MCLDVQTVVSVVLFFLISMDRPVCPMYMWPHSQSMLYTAIVLSLNRTKETGDIPRRQTITFYFVFGQHSAEPSVCRLDIWKKSYWGKLVFRIWGSNRRVEGPSYLFSTITFFSVEVVLKNSNSSWRFSVPHKALTVCTKVDWRLTCRRDGGVIQGSGRG